MLVNLHLTHKCNLRCTYCYTGDKTLHDMSDQTLADSFAFMEGLADREITLVFFGGEPLVRRDLLERAVWMGETSPFKRYYYKVATNGTLLSEELIEFCRAHRVYVSLSLDGIARANDANRIFPDGRGSYAAIRPWVRPLLRAMPYTGVFMVVHPGNMRDLPASVEHVLDLGFRFVNVALDHSAPWTPELFRTLARSYVQLAALYRRRIKKNEKFYLSLFDGRIQSHVRGPCEADRRCAAGLHQISIAPSGNLYPCVQFVREDRDEPVRIGHVKTGLVPTRRFAATDGAPDAICEACFLRDRCSHWCRCISYQATGSAEEVSPVFCAHEKMLFRIVDKMAGQLFSRAFPRFIHKHYNQEYAFLAAIEDLVEEAFSKEPDLAG